LKRLECGNSLIRKRLQSALEIRRLERVGSILPHFIIMETLKNGVAKWKIGDVIFLGTAGVVAMIKEGKVYYKYKPNEDFVFGHIL